MHYLHTLGKNQKLVFRELCMENLKANCSCLEHVMSHHIWCSFKRDTAIYWSLRPEKNVFSKVSFMYFILQVLLNVQSYHKKVSFLDNTFISNVIIVFTEVLKRQRSFEIPFFFPLSCLRIKILSFNVLSII